MSSGPTPPAVECRAVTLGYGGPPVVRDVDLSIAPGEMVALLGPSGSGKSTLLSAVAGFVPVSSGEVRLAGRLVSSVREHVPSERRRVGVVFQGYALWPHMSALDTVAYPIMRRGVDRRAARLTAGALLDRMGIGDLADRRPAELSGGEQQRVGLGRALARDADVHLFDEPTANLDAPLRALLQREIADERRRSGAAGLYATHDTAEALAIADRVALLRDGRIVQSGDPLKVYEQPVDLWAALLTGPASVLAVRVVGVHGGTGRLLIGDREVIVPVAAAGPIAGGEVRALVRPDWVGLGGHLPGRVTSAAFRGTHTDYGLDTPAGAVEIRTSGPPACGPGDAVTWSLGRVWVLPGEGEG